MRKITLALALLFTLQIISCAADETDSTNIEENTSEGTAGTVGTDEADEYKFPDFDYGGGKFVILNTRQEYNFYDALDFDEATGDSLDDAIYDRNRELEEKFNFEFEINNDYMYQDASTHLQNMVMANDDIYDAAFLRDNWMVSLLTNRMCMDMQNISGFNFDEPWWDSQAIEDTRFGSSQAIYYAFCDISLVDFEGTVVIFINENMTTELGLELPYDSVRDGSWTWDELNTLLTAGANLNGDDSFDWDKDASAVYGLVGYQHTMDSLIAGAGEDFFVKDESGVPHLATEGNRFFDVVDKMINMLTSDGKYLFLNGYTDPMDHYEAAFKNRRALMMTAQIKAANTYRDMEDSYGILPIPKYDESQQSYRCIRSYTYPLSIPVTNAEADSAAVILDAMAYLTYTDVMDDFYNGRISMKALRNEDSIDMLEIIRDSRYYDIGQAYGWSETIKEVFRNAVTKGNTEVASGIESVRTSIETSIESVMSMLDGQ